MKILLDTHFLIWSFSDTGKLTDKQKSQLLSPKNVIYVSAITVAEIMIKKAIGKLDITVDIDSVVKEMGFKLIDFTSREATLLADLPLHHRDPFDRMLICQAMANKMKIMTIDDKFKLYDCKLA